jgi:protein-disulfide isomerase
MTGSKGLKARRGSRLKPYIGTVAVLAVVFGGSALIGAHVRGAKEDTVKEPVGAIGQVKLALPVNPTVPVTLTVYEDLRSPASKAFAAEFKDTFAKLLAGGQVRIEYSLVTGSDAEYGGRGSLAAANAAACAQDLGRFQEYVDQLWAAQPTNPQDDAFASQKLLKDISKKAHKLDEAKFVPCVQDGDHDGWVRKSQKAFAAAGFTTAPVVQVNDQTVAGADGKKLTPAALRTFVRQAVKVAAANPSPTPTA